MIVLTREQRKEIHAKNTLEARALLQAYANLDVAQKKLVQERDDFGTFGEKLVCYENMVTEKTAQYSAALAAYQRS